MPVFRANGELHVFVHVPKCAGTTIEEHLVTRFGALGFIGASRAHSVSMQHLTWKQIIEILPTSWIAGSFAVVRHPLQRLVSAYNMRITQAKPPFPRETTITDFLDWVERRLPSVPSLLDNHLRPQVDFVGPDTKIFRFEEGLDGVIAHLDTSFGPRPDLPPLGHHDYRNPMTEGLFDISNELPEGVAGRVAELYAEDYARFGYGLAPTRPVKLRILKSSHSRPLRRTMFRVRSRIRLTAQQSGPGDA